MAGTILDQRRRRTDPAPQTRARPIFWWALGGAVVLFLLSRRKEIGEAGAKAVSAVERAARNLLTLGELRTAMPKVSLSRAASLVGPLARAMDEARINTPIRMAAFLSQIGHESGDLQFMQELWGPTDAQRRYEPPSDLARALGNTQPGDGFRFRGRGPLQLTGRANYKAFGDAVGMDFVSNPDLVADPEWGFRAAAWYWNTKNLNDYADAGNIDAVSQIVNGGSTRVPLTRIRGLADRRLRYDVARTALAA